MWYLEFLRIRRAVVTFALIILSVAIAGTIGLRAAHFSIGADVLGTSAGRHLVYVTAGNSVQKVPVDHLRCPLSLLLGVAGFLVVFMAAILRPSMNAEHSHLDYVFTRPVHRARIGVEYVLVDLVAFVAAMAIAFVIEFIPLVSVGELRLVFADKDVLWIVALTLGIAFMWYGEKQVATSWYRGSGGRVGGLSIISFFVLASLAAIHELGPTFHSVIVALNYVNPLAYLRSLTYDQGTVQARTLLPIGIGLRILLVWLIGLVCCAAAVTNWRRVEA